MTRCKGNSGDVGAAPNTSTAGEEPDPDCSEIVVSEETFYFHFEKG
jgi:hypothetical protein